MLHTSWGCRWGRGRGLTLADPDVSLRYDLCVDPGGSSCLPRWGVDRFGSPHHIINRDVHDATPCSLEVHLVPHWMSMESDGALTVNRLQPVGLDMPASRLDNILHAPTRVRAYVCACVRAYIDVWRWIRVRACTVILFKHQSCYNGSGMKHHARGTGFQDTVGPPQQDHPCTVIFQTQFDPLRSAHSQVFTWVFHAEEI